MAKIERNEMPLEGFICPDNERTTKVGCFESCRLNRRCLTLPTLMAVGQDREWKGTPSTTQSLQPTRMAWLKIKKPYYIKPEDRAFALLGIRHHSKLEVFAKIAGLVAEHKLDGEITGILDLLESDQEAEGMFILTDYKTWGSYQVQKYFEQYDLGDALLQQNHYRVKVERDETLAEALGFPVKISRQQLQITVRDGGLYIAENRRVDKKMYLLDVPKLDDQEVLDYFEHKSTRLLNALNANKLPPVCESWENWNRKRCKGFCDVWEFCPEGIKVNSKRIKGGE